MDSEFEDWARTQLASLLRAAYLLTGDQHAAEDLVQNTLEKVAVSWRRIDEYPNAYARQVLYRLQISRWRRRRVVEQLTERPPEHGGPDEMARADLRITMRKALAALTPAQRAVIVLRFYDDRTESEAAAVLGCSVGTVKSQSHKALEALRRSAPELAELVGRRLPTDA